jgi:hypothetical protein
VLCSPCLYVCILATAVQSLDGYSLNVVLGSSDVIGGDQIEKGVW